MSEETTVVNEAVTEATPETVVKPVEETSKEEAVKATPEVKSEVKVKTIVEDSVEEKTEESSEDSIEIGDYELKAPEGMELDKTLLEKFTPLFKKSKLSNETVQEFSDVFAPYMKEVKENMQQEFLGEFNKIRDGWDKESRALLWPNPKASLGIIAKAINKYGDADLIKACSETGVGSHPALVKFFLKVGEGLSEDKLVESNNDKMSVDPLEVLYPTMKKG